MPDEYILPRLCQRLDISLDYILKYEKGCMIMHAWLLKSVLRAP